MRAAKRVVTFGCTNLRRSVGRLDTAVCRGRTENVTGRAQDKENIGFGGDRKSRRKGGTTDRRMIVVGAVIDWAVVVPNLWARKAPARATLRAFRRFDVTCRPLNLRPVGAVYGSRLKVIGCLQPFRLRLSSGARSSNSRPMHTFATYHAGLEFQHQRWNPRCCLRMQTSKVVWQMDAQGGCYSLRSGHQPDTALFRLNLGISALCAEV